VEAAWVAMGCDSYFGDLYKKKRALGKKANTAILCVARRMVRITWQLLTQGRDYQKIPPAPQPKANAAKPKANAAKPKANAAKPKANAAKPKANAAKPKANAAKPKANAAKAKTKQTFPSRSNRTLVGC
jgi:hypothetical protein